MGALRLGVRLPLADALDGGEPLAHLAGRLEAIGFDSLWCSDHVVMTRDASRSRYPFSDDGSISWPADAPMPDALVAMGQAAAGTRRVEIGCAVLVLPQRHPVVLAKQVATLDALSGGRVALGVGVGWYREEFEALGWDFDTRGARFDEWVELLRRCWTGEPAAFAGAHYDLPAGTVCRPVPARPVPLLVGGVSAVALRRAATQGDGWLGLQRAGRLDVDAVAHHVDGLRQHRAEAGRSPDEGRVVLRIIESADRTDDVAAALPALAAAGVDEVVVDVDTSHEARPERAWQRLAEAAADG
jgi:probable F420-dependent oxidoreductase